MEETKIKILLTKKQELFCRHYVKNGHNGTKAAISAGYSKKIANRIAAENMTKPVISAFIKKLEEPVIKKLEITEDWVLSKLKNFSDVQITDFFEIDFKTNTIQLKDFSKISPDKIAAIESIKETKNGIEIKLVDKRASVVDIGKHLGMFKEQIEGNFNHNHIHKVYVIPAFNSNVDSTSTNPG